MRNLILNYFSHYVQIEENKKKTKMPYIADPQIFVQMFVFFFCTALPFIRSHALRYENVICYAGWSFLFRQYSKRKLKNVFLSLFTLQRRRYKWVDVESNIEQYNRYRVGVVGRGTRQCNRTDSNISTDTMTEAIVTAKAIFVKSKVENCKSNRLAHKGKRGEAKVCPFISKQLPPIEEVSENMFEIFGNEYCA